MLSIVNGNSFLQTAESITSMHFSTFVADTNDHNVINFKENVLYHTPNHGTLEATFLDTFYSNRDVYESVMAIPTTSISIDDTFIIGKAGSHKDKDDESIQNKVFFILNEKNEIVDFHLAKTLSEVELEPMIRKLKYVLDNEGTQLECIYVADLCQCHSYQSIFPEVPVKLNLSHCVQRIKKCIKDKRDTRSQAFINDIGLIFRETSDRSRAKILPTSSPNCLLTNLDDFRKDHNEYINSLSPEKQEKLYNAFENMKRYIEIGYLSGIPVICRAPSNERLHHYLNRSLLKGSNNINLELAIAIITLFAYVYNIKSKSEDRIVPFEIIPSFLSSSIQNFKPLNEQETPEQITNFSSILDLKEERIIETVIDQIVNSHNTFQKFQKKCFRKGYNCYSASTFFVLHNKNIDSTGHDHAAKLRNNLAAFNLELDKTPADGDCLFSSILQQYDKLPSTPDFQRLHDHLSALQLKEGNLKERIMKLRYGNVSCFVK